MLIGADKGLFLAREVNGRVTVTAATNANTGGVSGLHEFPGGTVLVGAGNGLFLAREANGLVTVAPVPAQTGTVTNLLGLPDGAVLIQAASGWFLGREEANGRVTVASTGKVDTGAIFGLRKLPGGTVLIGAKNGLFFAGEGNERVAVTAANANTGDVSGLHEFPGGRVLVGTANGLFFTVPTSLSDAVVTIRNKKNLDESPIDRDVTIEFLMMHECAAAASNLGLKVRVTAPASKQPNDSDRQFTSRLLKKSIHESAGV